jgi:hypothetical protein
MGEQGVCWMKRPTDIAPKSGAYRPIDRRPTTTLTVSTAAIEFFVTQLTGSILMTIYNSFYMIIIG